MMHPAIVVREEDTIQGKGLVATAPIPAGSVVWEMDPSTRIVTLAEVESWTHAEQDAFHLVGYQCAADSFAVCEGIERYMNHSCDPNTWWEGSCAMVARRAIAAGEEVTYDYATSEIALELAMLCACGSPVCRGMVTNHDYLDPAWQARYGHHLPDHVLAAMAGARRGARVT